MRSTLHLLTRLTLLILVVGLLWHAPEFVAASAEKTKLKCSECHKLSGPHASLNCSNCHRVSVENMTLHVKGIPHIRGNSSEVSLSSIKDPMDLNDFCGRCHSDIYEDYLLLAHGNATFTARGEERYVLVGYKGIRYILHIAPDYTNLVKKNARACVECHDPHDPLLKPLNIMPVQSYRPSPPDERWILLYGIIVVLASTILIYAVGRGWLG